VGGDAYEEGELVKGFRGWCVMWISLGNCRHRVDIIPYRDNYRHGASIGIRSTFDMFPMGSDSASNHVQYNKILRCRNKKPPDSAHPRHFTKSILSTDHGTRKCKASGISRLSIVIQTDID
jgi:hypothetical protein